MMFFLMGLGAVGWAGYIVVTGKGYYKGCPPGGFDRVEDPVWFWLPTIIIGGLGVFLILIFFGAIQLPAGR
jgi:hypothetical protein